MSASTASVASGSTIRHFTSGIFRPPICWGEDHSWAELGIHPRIRCGSAQVRGSQFPQLRRREFDMPSLQWVNEEGAQGVASCRRHRCGSPNFVSTRGPGPLVARPVNWGNEKAGRL